MAARSAPCKLSRRRNTADEDNIRQALTAHLEDMLAGWALQAQRGSRDAAEAAFVQTAWLSLQICPTTSWHCPHAENDGATLSQLQHQQQLWTGKGFVRRWILQSALRAYCCSTALTLISLGPEGKHHPGCCQPYTLGSRGGLACQAVQIPSMGKGQGKF